MYETGDAGIRDKDGRFQIAGRMDDIINIGKILNFAKCLDIEILSGSSNFNS